MKKFLFLALLLIAISISLLYGLSTNKIQNKSLKANKKKETKALQSKADKKKGISAKENIKVYFLNNSALKAEQIEGKNDPKNAINLLLKGPKEKSNTSVIPKNVSLISLRQKKGRIIINFSKEILDNENASAESEELTIYSIVNTLTEFKNIKEVVIQVEGKSEGEIGEYLVEDFWGHIGLYDQPFKRNPSLIKN